MDIEPLAPEQLRGIVQARVAELHAYQYMDQVLSAVVEAQASTEQAKAELAMVKKEIAAQQQHLDRLAAEYADKHEALEERYHNREAALRARLADAQAALDDKSRSLASWQDHLASIENEHKANLATWQDRIQQARVEYSAIQAKKDAAQQQMDALAAMIGRK